MAAYAGFRPLGLVAARATTTAAAAAATAAATTAAAAAHLAEAIRAVDGAVARRHERHFGLLAAVRAGDLSHLARSAVVTAAAAAAVAAAAAAVAAAAVAV